MRKTTTIILGLLLAGCARDRAGFKTPPPAVASTAVCPVRYDEPAPADVTRAQTVKPPAAPETQPAELPAIPVEEIPSPSPAAADITLLDVVNSVRLHFPLVQAAAAQRTIASGEVLAAAGAFDHKLKAESYNTPLGFYETHRHAAGLERTTYYGSQVFAGYRIGRGSFEPWYKERETNEGGEFKAGFMTPLLQNRWTDPNRAELWRAQLETQRVEPEIAAQIIMFVRDGSATYWEWVAAGENFRITDGLLELANKRTKFLESQVKEGEKPKIDLVDNRRLIVSREAKQIDARRKLDQTAVKLSLFLRDAIGVPVVPNIGAPPEFPAVDELAADAAERDILAAQVNRPELSELRLVRRQLDVALNQARNETWPELNAGLTGAQDVGEPASSLRDKSPFELETGLQFSVPLERRKAWGKIRQLQGKLAQLQAKTQFTSEKIGVEVAIARTALIAAAQRVKRTTESLELARRMQTAEGTVFEEGQSTLLNLNIREVQAADAATERIAAQFEYFLARADYLAALGLATGEPPAEAFAADAPK